MYICSMNGSPIIWIVLSGKNGLLYRCTIYTKNIFEFENLDIAYNIGLRSYPLTCQASGAP